MDLFRFTAQEKVYLDSVREDLIAQVHVTGLGQDLFNLKKARSGHIKVIDLLIDNKSDIMATTKNGLTPLHMARLLNLII